MIEWMPEFVLLCVVDPAKPPGYHGGGTVGHVGCCCDVVHSFGVDGIAGFGWWVGCCEEEFCFGNEKREGCWSRVLSGRHAVGGYEAF